MSPKALNWLVCIAAAAIVLNLIADLLLPPLKELSRRCLECHLPIEVEEVHPNPARLLTGLIVAVWFYLARYAAPDVRDAIHNIIVP